ncbi:MAG TPA: pyridoxamine 5'-phosphate oxidase family protein [Thermomicrobiales bacterium]|nr:pyridoxamine 5'-phosphate oxidase family protein [Thermomicrobiales bacterium]
MTTPAAGFTRPGREGRLRPEEVDAFLARPLLCRLACLDGEGWPYVVPTWYEWDSEVFWLVPREKSAWAAYLAAEPRVALCIDDAESGRRVVCRGTARLEEEPNVGGRWVEIARRMAVRYRGDEGAAYLEATRDQPRWLFSVAPARLVTWRGTGWHERYAR